MECWIIAPSGELRSSWRWGCLHQISELRQPLGFAASSIRVNTHIEVLA